MGARGELFTTKVLLDNRSYFFNVKENRTGDVFLQIVESKSRGGEDFERRDIVVFADTMQKFLGGLDESLSFMEKEHGERSRSAFERKMQKDNAPSSLPPTESAAPELPKRTGRLHIFSKRPS